MNTIADSLQSARLKISQFAQQSGKNSESIQLLAVSKTKPTNDIRDAYQAGHRQFGENYLQEGVDKVIALSELNDIEWHFIGPIQSNKTRPIAEHFDWVQTVSREKIAKRLAEQRPTDKPALNVLIQVNISGEAAKSGLPIDQIEALATFIVAQPTLSLRGLMAIPEHTEDNDKLAEQFQQMQLAYRKLQHNYPSVDTLSMGMSGDMALAIANGSNMVRLGTAIFGARTPKPQ